MKIILITAISILFFFGCTQTEKQKKSIENKQDTLVQLKKEILEKDNSKQIKMYSEIEFANDSLIELVRLDSSFRVDIPYATDSNFTKTTLYPCNKCLIRYKVALALIKANDILKEKGLRLKMLDCYRPLSVQRKMWEVLPNPVYVADPNSKNASMHNRGIAVDVTIIDNSENELDMGTGFDFFGVEAHPTYRNFSDTILANRDLIRKTMLDVGFRNSRSEWWHFSLKGVFYKVEDLPLPCD